MQIDVIKPPALHRFKNDVGRRMSRKADMSRAPLLLQIAGRRKASVLLERPSEQFTIVNSVQRKQINVVETQILHRSLKNLQKLPRVRLRRDFGLHDDFVARQFRQDRSELHLRSAVAARGFDVIYSQFQRPMNGGLQIGLIVCGNFAGSDILPFELVPHPPAGNDRHRQFRSTKPPISHGGFIALFGGNRNT